MRDFTNGLFKFPSKEERIAARAGAMFFSGWLAWTMDAWDFFSVSLSVTALAKEFDKEASDVTLAITLTLLLRSLGAVIFGLLSDRYGRKWPLVANLVIIAVLSLGTGFVHTFGAFLGVRCLFGLGMGGIWGAATATALENMPAAPRGLFSGILQQGYAVGYLFAASANLAWIQKSGNWRDLFYLGAGLSLFAAFVRMLLPESELFRRQQEERKASGTAHQNKAKQFAIETGHMLKTCWGRVVFGILLMTGFNFLSHSSQDLYPTIIQNKLSNLPLAEAKELSSKATIIGNCGAIAGGLIAGYLSQYLGRRLTIIMFVLFTGAMIAPWIVPTTFSGLAAGAFFVQFGVQGAWGVVPIYLSEISPPAFRATFPGVAYQIGNMVSSASSQIEATGGEHNQVRNPRYGQPGAGAAAEKPTIPDYAKVSGILLGVVCAYLIAVVIFGKEYRGAAFEKAPLATDAHAGDVNPDQLKQQDSAEHIGDVRQDRDDASSDEKGSNKDDGVYDANALNKA